MTPESFLLFASPLPEPMMLLSGGGFVLALNRAGQDQFGVRAQEWRDKPLADLIIDPPDEIARYLQLCSRSRQTVLGTVTIRGPDEIAFRAEGSLIRPRTEESAAVLMVRLVPKQAATAQFIALNLRIEELARENQRRRLAEQEARENAERLRTTLTSIGDGVIATDINGCITHLNPVAESLTGWTNNEAIGVPLTQVFNIVNETTRQPVENPADRALREGTIVGLANHTVLLAKDGTERPIDDSAAPIRTADRRIVGCVLVFRDITERKAQEVAQAERVRVVALRADISTNLTLTHPTPTALHRCCEALVLHLDAAFARIWIVNPTDNVLELQASAGLYTHLDGPHSRVPVGQFKIGRIADTRQPHVSNSVKDDPSVSDRAWAAREGMVAFAGYPLEIEDRVIGVVAMFARHPFSEGILDELAPLADVIAQYIQRKRSEQQLAEALRFYHSSIDALSSHIAVLDENGVILEVNHAWRHFAEMNHFAGFNCGVGVNYIEVCESSSGECADDESIARGIRDVLAGRSPLFEFEYPCHSPTEERWFLMRVTRFQSPGPVRVVVSHDNVTERRVAEEGLRKLAAELSDADRRKNEFLATLAHELRNPLAPIRNGLQLIQLARGDWATIEQTRDLIDRQFNQMVRLVDDLMDVSRISTGKVQLRKERVPLASVVQSAVETSRPLIEQMGHGLTVTLPQHPLVLEVDQTRLAQIFLNLLNNAAKYSERNGRIWLTAEQQGSEVVVSVKDAGIGIPTDQLPRVFEMFSQVDRSLEKSQGGLGIGLCLVKRLVELHGGRIEALSEGPGKGSEFVVRLPVVVESSAPPEEVRRQEVNKSALRILIVDDNRDSADSLAMMLKMMGNETCTAYDGEAAVTAADRFRPDVILLDIGLPKLNGHEACRRIRGLGPGPDMVIIAQTGWGQKEDRQRTHEAGFDHHLVKPVDPQALMKLLRSLSKRADRQLTIKLTCPAAPQVSESS